MIVIEDSFNKKIKESTYIVLGSFDGLHIGHRKLIDTAVELAKMNNSKSMIFTFKNHPLSIINSEIAPKILMDNETKINLLEKYSIDIVNMAIFNEKFMKISPEDFIKNIISYYNAKGIVVGFNYRFGFKNLGDVELLHQFSTKYNFELHIVEPVKYQGEVISSSRIRTIISDGDIELANYMLTRPYMISGEVIEGKKLGRTIGYPTINLGYDKKILLPRGGVYYTIVQYKGNKYKAITNIGYNPTVQDNKLSIETYILDFDKYIYGEKVSIHFIKRIRDEKKFNSLEELTTQLDKDKSIAINSKIIDII